MGHCFTKGRQGNIVITVIEKYELFEINDRVDNLIYQCFRNCITGT